jgi:hypothetical protein
VIHFTLNDAVSALGRRTRTGTMVTVRRAVGEHRFDVQAERGKTPGVTGLALQTGADSHCGR